MKEEEEEPNWFSRWEEKLPSPEELMPLSQSLISQDLAVAFDISLPNSNYNCNNFGHQNNNNFVPSLTLSPSQSQQHQQNLSQRQLGEYESSEINGGNSGGGVGGGGDEQARTLKRPRLVWTPQLHKRFVDAVAHLGIKNAVPKTIMQLMSVDGLTRENVASHLQKYRLYLKRMQGISSGNAHPSMSQTDAATEQLFASSPIPRHFLSQRPAPCSGGPGGPDHFLRLVPVGAPQHHQQMAAAVQQQQFYHHRHMDHLGLPPGGVFDHGFVARQQHSGMHRVIGPAAPTSGSRFMEDSDSVAGGAGRKVLTLFPTNDN